MGDKYDRILVIDDDEMARESYSEMLDIEGYTVKSADSAEKAIEIMKKWPVHLFLLDIMLPKMTGIELLKKLDIMHNIYEVIIITAYGDMDTAKKAMELGAFSYLSKPIEFKNLAPLVKKAMEIVKQKKIKLDYLNELEKKIEERTKKLEKEIEERKKTEAALRESEKRLKEAQKVANLGYWHGDLKTGTIEWSGEMFRMLGIKPRSLTPEFIIGLIHPNDRESYMKMLEKATTSEKSFKADYRAIRPDGKLRHFHVIGRIERDESGKAIRISVIIQDITERKQAEESLKKSEERYRTIVNSMSDLIFVLDERNCFQEYYTASNELLFKDPLKFIGKKHCDIMPKKIDDIFQKSVKEVRKDGMTRNFEYSLKIKNTERWFSASLDLHKDGKSIVSVIRDITERREIEEALKESNEFLHNLISSMRDGFSVLDEKGVHINVNPSFCRMTGFKKEELIGTGIPHPYWPEDEYDTIRKKFKKTLNEDFEEIEMVFKRKNGERFPVLVNPSSVKDSNGKVISYFATVRDIKEQKKAEEALRDNQKTLFEQNIMLQEKNIALREVMDQLEAEKDRLGKTVNTNVDRLILPLVEKLKNKYQNLDKTYIDLLEENVKELTSQFGSKVSDKMLRLTQKEIGMCTMIKQGLTSKEIANLSNISYRTVETHRSNIRKKLGIGKQEVNLVTYLKSMA